MLHLGKDSCKQESRLCLWPLKPVLWESAVHSKEKKNYVNLCNLIITERMGQIPRQDKYSVMLPPLQIPCVSSCKICKCLTYLITLTNFLKYKDAYSGYLQRQDTWLGRLLVQPVQPFLHYNSMRSLPLSIKLDGATHSVRFWSLEEGNGKSD